MIVYKRILRSYEQSPNLPSIGKPHIIQASCLPAGTVAGVAPLNRTISSSVLEVVYRSGEVPAIAADKSRSSLAFGRSIKHRSIAMFDWPMACVPDLFTHRILARGDEGNWGRTSLALLQFRHVYRPKRQMPDSHLGPSLNKKHYINKKDSHVDAKNRVMSEGGKRSSSPPIDYKQVCPATDCFFSVST